MMKSKAQKVLKRLIELFDKYPQTIKPHSTADKTEVGNQTKKQ
jgi:hypothetical protein